ncbi:MAG: metallophosphoesterase family protein [Christensenellales bacterium]|jgi:putative phosphoesterase
MLSVVHAQHPDAILHLGDHFADGLLLQKQTDLRTHLVKGNTDQEYDASEEELITFEKTRVYMTHGHMQSVHNRLTELCDTGARNNARIVLFGHTR